MKKIKYFLLIPLLIACINESKNDFVFKYTTDTLNYSNEVSDVKVLFPVFNHQYTDSVIGQNIKSMFNQFKHETGDVVISENWKNEQNIDFECFYSENGILSVYIKNYQYTGGAHGNTFLSSLNFNPEKKEMYIISDFFKTNALKSLQQQVRNQLKKQLADTTFVEEGTATLADFSVFTLNKDSIAFYFPPYQVAAYSFGSPIVRLAINELEEFTIPQ